ncbi:MAG TPA: hypothetical protein VM600_10675 [Actinomycetota bacterium]|nr:hypothetical protein [Actinomycetota bacterium]
MRDERGSVLIPVVLATSVLTLIAMTVTTGTLSSAGQSSSRRAWEQAVYLGQAGASRALSLLNADPDYDTNVTMPADADRDWAIATAAAAPVESAREGEFAWIVPKNASSVFGIGYAPSRTQPRATRVIRVDYEIVPGSNPAAFLTASALTVSGNVEVSGLGGTVHSNGDLTISGNPTIAQHATASGQYLETGRPTIGGDKGGGYSARAMPVVDVLSLRSLTEYDLCPDATVRATSPAVCGGSVLGTGLVAGWNGWRYAGTTWRQSGNTTIDGGFFVHWAGVDIAGSPGSPANPWRATIVVEGVHVGPAITSGDVTISGNPSMRARASGVQVVADRDLVVTGNPTLEGLMMAGEHVRIAGTPRVTGSIVAAGIADTAGSPVPGNAAVGNFDLIAEFGAPTVQGGVREVRWDEL